MSIEVSVSAAPSLVSTKDVTPYERWKTEIEYAEKELEKFHTRADKVVRRFIDERDSMDSARKWFNIFYANTNILESAIYAQLPKPQITRKFIDYTDDVARVAANILQRNVEPDEDDPRDTFDSVIRHSVQDRLISGLSMAWCRLETDTEMISPEPGMEYRPEDEQMALEGMENETPADEAYEKIKDQRVCIDYIYWKDFLWSPCRVWEERRWTGRKAYLSRDELVRRFGEDKGGKVPLNYRSAGHKSDFKDNTPKNEALEKAVVYELWDRLEKRVIWLCKDWPDLLDDQEDFLELEGFEPHPTPMLANITTSNTCPRPDYFMLQDQYSELDTVNNRISLLVEACKVVGVYAKNEIGIQNMLKEGFDNQLIPVDNWAMFAEKGGLKGQIDWLPLDMVVTAMQRLYEAREAIKGQIYELTGIADIVRGASKASETLGAQQIKAQFASVRIKKLQDEVGRYVGELLRLKAEITVKHVDPEIILRKSNMLQTDDANLVGPAMELLLSDEGFEWRIGVDSDSMGQTDYAMEKTERTELLGVVGGFVQKSQPMLENPKWAPLMINLLKWTISGFKGSREIEGMIDKQLDAIAKQPPAPPQPNPEMIKAQTAQQVGQQKIQQGQQKMQMDQQNHQMGLQETMVKVQAAKEMHAQDLQAAQAAATIDLNGQQVEAAFNTHKMQMDRAAETAAYVNELRKSNLEHSTNLRKASLEIRKAEIANEAAVAKARQIRSTKAGKPKT